MFTKHMFAKKPVWRCTLLHEDSMGLIISSVVPSDATFLPSALNYTYDATTAHGAVSVEMTEITK